MKLHLGPADTGSLGIRSLPKPVRNDKKWQACFQPLSSRVQASETERFSSAYIAIAQT